MKYGKAYESYKFSEIEMNTVYSAISKVDKLHDATINLDSECKITNELVKNRRSSQISWLDDSDLSIMLLEIVLKVNYTAAWNLNIIGCEPAQYTQYNKDDFYNWHLDQGPPQLYNNWLFVRKISMTLFLSNPNEYTGGELELEIHQPNDTNESRSVFLKEPKCQAVFFLSDTYHRVQPITSGTRNS